MNTKFELTYRDAHNYKKFAVVVLSGAITNEQIAKITPKLNDGSGIICHQVGLPTITGFDQNSTYDDDIDHVFTEIDQWEGSNEAPTPDQFLTTDAANVTLSIADFTHRMVNLSEWDIPAELDRIGGFY